MTRSIVIFADHRLSQYLEVLLKSIFLATNGREETTIYLINYDYPSDLLLHYVKQCQKHLKNCQIKVRSLSAEQKEVLDNLTFASNLFYKSMYGKLLIADLLPNEDQVLFLDTETIVLQDLHELLNYPMADDVSIYACHDHLLERSLRFELKDSYLNSFKYLYKRGLAKYPEEIEVFSSQVMLLNLKRLREQQISKHYLQYLTSDFVKALPHVNLYLNLTHRLDWQPLPDKFNYQVDYINEELIALNKLEIEVVKYADLDPKPSYNLPVVISFTGINKPLNSNAKLPFRRLFMELYNESISEILLNRNVFDVNSLIKSYNYLHLLKLNDQGNYIR
ncbi:hypothetical protein CKF54_00205 [Psittacicella hinzii]|uniref:Uncharacterized protein n=1 Tax=Psittacicella hinzii TaxID=2028575 RepID=A0A3A1Y8C7_9GAMM|nr:glycosyltransferase [Psittacicella hinzii]RIY34452.1 hypothetical protein CKF54_00205 [Psittacicella hinzii]